MRGGTLTILMALVMSFGAGVEAQERVVRRAPTGPSVKMATLEGERAILPITLAGATILVDDVYVNGEGPFRFLLDTGAQGGGRVDASLVEKLSLAETGQVMGSDGSGRAGPTMTMHQLDTLAFGGLTFEGVRVISRDYNLNGAGVRGHIDGILGFALFEEFLLTIDYDTRELRVARGELPEPNGTDIFELSNHGAPGVDIVLGGRKHHARIDSGNMGGLTVSQRIADDLEFEAEPVQVGEARTVTGAFPISRGTITGDLSIGDLHVEKPEVTIAGPMPGVNLGSHMLQEFVVTFDQAHERIRFQKADSTRPEGAPRSSRLARQTTEVPMPLVMGRPTIEATINGQGPYRFILDTGASMLVLFDSLAEELGLEATGSTRVGDPSSPQAVAASEYQVAAVGVGETTAEGVYAISLPDMPGVGDVRGVFGLPVLHDLVTTLDYPGERLVLSRAPLGRNDGSVAYRDEGGQINFDLDIAGHPIETHLDTGSPGALSLPLSLAEDLPLQAPPTVVGRGRTVSGEFEIHSAQLDGTLSWLGTTIEDPQLMFNDRFAWGNLGGGLLQDFELTIDQVNRRLRLQEPQGPRVVRRGPAGRPRWGFGLRGQGGGAMSISQVMSGGIAEAAGLKAGDVIVKVNGRAMDAIDQAELGAIMQSSPITLTVERDGREIDIELRRPE